MNLFLKELKFNKKSIIIWSICIFLLLFIGVGKEFSMMTSSGAESMNELMENFPKSAKVIFGMNDYDLSKIEGYYSMMSMYIFIIVGIQAAMLGTGILAKEEIDKTFEFLCVKPISRIKIVISKFCAAVVNMLILNIVTFVASIYSIYCTGNLTNELIGKITYLMFGMFLLQLIFSTAGMLIYSSSKKAKMASAITSAIVLITFFISKLIDLKDNIEFLKYLTPFKYFDAGEIMFENNMNTVYIILSLFLIITFFIGTNVLYRKKDLNV